MTDSTGTERGLTAWEGSASAGDRGSAPVTRRYRWLAPGALTLVLVVMLAVNAVSGWAPDGWEWFFSADAGWTIPLVLVLLALTVLAYSSQRPGEPGRALMVVIGVVPVVLVLGLSSYWECAGGTAPLIMPLTWTAALFTGSVETAPFTADGSCPGAVPLALQLAGVLALSVTFFGVGAAAWALWRGQYARLRARLAHDVDVVVGLDQLSLPLIRSLIARASGTSDRRRVVVITATPDDPAATAVAADGAMVVAGDPRSEDDLRAVLTWRGRNALHRFYALSGSGRFNRLSVAAARRALAEVPGVADEFSDVMLTIRLDDPREAESWRASQLELGGWFIHDAISAHEVTAALLVEQLRERRVRDVILVGDGPMLTALLVEFSWLQAWDVVVADARSGAEDPIGEPPRWGMLDSLTVVTPDGTKVTDEWSGLAERIPSRQLVPGLRPQFHEVAAGELLSWLEERLPGLAGPGVVFMADAAPTERHLASRLARVHPQVPVFVPDPEAVGVAPDPVHDTLIGYGLALQRDSVESRRRGVPVIPDNGWWRLAMLQHEFYRYRRLRRTDDPRPPQLPWDELSEDVKRGNITQIKVVYDGFAGLGYRWVTGLVAGDDVSLRPQDVDVVAQQMHASWVEQRREQGYLPGPETDDDATPPTNSRMVAWDEAPADLREWNHTQVLAVVERIAMLGLRPVR